MMASRDPVTTYRATLDSGDFQYDESQNRMMRHLQRVYEDLITNSEQGNFFSRMFIRTQHSPVKGLYLWGGVGRGKTCMMDMFYQCLPFKEKKRIHFHRFMKLVHGELQRFQGLKNPLEKIAAKFADETRVICFDEFHVSDITDAMILANLLEALFRRKVVLVATSNVEPKNLYENGLQRRRFLPAIDLIETHTEVFNVDGTRDYRLRVLKMSEIYHSPLDEMAEINLETSFEAIAPDEGGRDVQLDIENRTINTRRCADGVVWFTFTAVCDGPRSQNDYIELARLFQTVLLSDVPRLESDNQARRFISLVDEFYDRNVKLIISAEVPIKELYSGTLLRFEFRRTASRLQEMQSEEYLSREHRP